MGLVETEGIVLRNIKLGEADKIVTVMSRHAGVVRGVAKGARRLKSRFGASLEPFTHIQLTFFEKEARELVTLTHAEIVKSYFDLTRDDRVLAPLEYLSGIVVEFAPLRAPDERFFRLLSASLEALAAEPGRVEEIVLYCEVWTLKLAGFLPDVSLCAVCRCPFEKDTGAPSLGAGSALECRSCSAGKGTPIPLETLRELEAILRTRPAAWVRAEKTRRSPSGSETNSLIRTLLTRALEREPKLRARLG